MVKSGYFIKSVYCDYKVWLGSKHINNGASLPMKASGWGNAASSIIHHYCRTSFVEPCKVLICSLFCSTFIRGHWARLSGVGMLMVCSLLNIFQDLRIPRYLNFFTRPAKIKSVFTDLLTLRFRYFFFRNILWCPWNKEIHAKYIDCYAPLAPATLHQPYTEDEF